MNSFELTVSNGKTVTVAIRRSARARRIRLRVAPAGPELVIPQFAPLEPALAFLRAQTAWLEQTLRTMRPAPLPARPENVALAFTGETLSIVYTPLDGSTPECGCPDRFGRCFDRCGVHFRSARVAEAQSQSRSSPVFGTGLRGMRIFPFRIRNRTCAENMGNMQFQTQNHAQRRTPLFPSGDCALCNHS